MKKAISFLALLSISFACHAQLNAEQASIKKVFFDFLSFYKKNETKFNSFHLYKGKGKENGPKVFNKSKQRLRPTIEEKKSWK